MPGVRGDGAMLILERDCRNVLARSVAALSAFIFLTEGERLGEELEIFLFTFNTSLHTDYITEKR